MSKTQLARVLMENLKSMNETNEMLQKKLDDIFGCSDKFMFDFEKRFDDEKEKISACTGIHIEAIEWFIYENLWGKRKYKCVKPDCTIEYEIKDIKSFVEFELGE